MELMKLSFGVALPWLLGAAWINLMPAYPSPGRRAIVFGYGYLFGSVALTLLMRGIDALGMALSFRNVAVAGLSALMAALLINARLRRARLNALWLSPELRDLPVWQKVLFASFLALVALRLAGLALEVVWRPLFPWDAALHWAREAKVWFESSRILPFVDYDTWLSSGDPHVYTSVAPDYPSTVPLLQVWVDKAIGHWDDSLMNLPWIACATALGIAFYGQARLAAVRPVAAITFTYFLLSMPLLDTHVALAGYADIFLGACYLAAVMALYQWSVGRDRGQAMMAGVMALSCLLLKNEGLFWALTLVPAWLIAIVPRRAVGLLLGAGLVLVIGALWLWPPDLPVAGHTLRQLDLHLRQEALRPLGQSFWLFDSWHLTAYLFVGVMLVGLLRLGPAARKYLSPITAVGTAGLLLAVLFAFTGAAGGAIRFTAVSRVSLHLVPAYTFLLMLVFNDLTRLESSTNQASHSAAGDAV
jgi:hypothetical protein